MPSRARLGLADGGNGEERVDDGGKSDKTRCTQRPRSFAILKLRTRLRRPRHCESFGLGVNLGITRSSSSFSTSHSTCFSSSCTLSRHTRSRHHSGRILESNNIALFLRLVVLERTKVTRHPSSALRVNSSWLLDPHQLLIPTVNTKPHYGKH